MLMLSWLQLLFPTLCSSIVFPSNPSGPVQFQTSQAYPARGLLPQLKLQIGNNLDFWGRAAWRQRFWHGAICSPVQFNLYWEALGKVSAEYVWRWNIGFKLLLKQCLNQPGYQVRLSLTTTEENLDALAPALKLAQTFNHQEAIQKLETELHEYHMKSLETLSFKQTSLYQVSWHEDFLPLYHHFNQLYAELEEAYTYQALTQNDKATLHKLKEIQDISLTEAEAVRLALMYQGIICPWLFLERVLDFFQVYMQNQSLDVILEAFKSLPAELKAWKSIFQAEPLKERCIEKTQLSFEVLQIRCGKQLYQGLDYKKLGLAAGPYKKIFHKEVEVQSSLSWLLYLHFNLPEKTKAAQLEHQLGTLSPEKLDMTLDNELLDQFSLFYRAILKGTELLAKRKGIIAAPMELFFKHVFQRFSVERKFWKDAHSIALYLCSESNRKSCVADAWKAQDLYLSAAWLHTYFEKFLREMEARFQKLQIELNDFKVSFQLLGLGKSVTSNLKTFNALNHSKIIELFQLGVEGAFQAPSFWSAVSRCLLKPLIALKTSFSKKKRIDLLEKYARELLDT